MPPLPGSGVAGSPCGTLWHINLRFIAGPQHRVVRLSHPNPSANTRAGFGLGFKRESEDWNAAKWNRAAKRNDLRELGRDAKQAHIYSLTPLLTHPKQ